MKPSVVAVLCAILAVCAACGGPHYIQDLPLLWKGVDKYPSPTTAVEKAFAAAPLELGELKDSRRGDRSAVGSYVDDGFVVTTKGDVAEFWRTHFRAMLESAGAQVGVGKPEARLDAELLEFDCTEDNMFNATVRMRVTVSRNGRPPWTKTYEGKSKRWGRSHNPENFDEALSNALHEATRKLVQDPTFASALVGEAAAVSSGVLR